MNLIEKILDQIIEIGRGWEQSKQMFVSLLVTKKSHDLEQPIKKLYLK